MVLTPLAMLAFEAVMPAPEQSLDGVDTAEDLSGSVLVIGFGRFGQIVSQPLLLRGIDVSIIDNDVEMIQTAAKFGFKVYYGDGTRLDILHAAGAGRARAVIIWRRQAGDGDPQGRTPQGRVPASARAGARLRPRHGHLADQAGVDFQLRETLESALVVGSEALKTLGVEEEEVAEIIADVRRRDAERLDLQLAGGIQAGRGLMKVTRPYPRRWRTPRRPGGR